MNAIVRRVSALTLAVPLLFTGAAVASAQGPDTAAPEVVDYSVTSDDGDDDLTFFIEDEPATFTVSVRITDETGLDRTTGLFNPGNPTMVVSSVDTDQSVGFGGMTLVSGDTRDGVYEKTVTIPDGHAPGDWEVTLYPLNDTLGNGTDLGDFAFFGTLGVVTITYGTPVEPADVSFDDEARTYTVPATEGIEYLVDGEVVSAGTYEATGSVEITARALDGFVIDGAAAWTHTFAVESVTADAVTFQDNDGAADDTYTVPASTGIEYLVDGTVIEAGTHEAAGEVTVTARALPGYELTGTSTWSHTFDATTAVTPRAPSFNEDKSSYFIPTMHGVQYLVNGTVTPGGSHRGSGEVTITARALEGYTLTGTTSWGHTFTPAAPPFIDVKPGVEHYEHMIWLGTGSDPISRGWTTSAGQEYRPLNNVNRDAMAAFLYRMAGEPAVELPATSPFTDMHPGQEHYKEVVWAYQEDITTGWTMPDGTRQFRPVQPINRDAMAAFMYRFADEPAYTAPSGACFTDVATTMMYAKEMCWMKNEGISNGWSDGTYRPLQPVKRDAMAAFLHRYATN